MRTLYRVLGLCIHESVNNTRCPLSGRGQGHVAKFVHTLLYSSLALEWIPEGGRRMAGRPMRTWQDTVKEDLRFRDERCRLE